MSNTEPTEASRRASYGVDFSFRFPAKSNSRFTYAEVEITFEHALTRRSLRYGRPTRFPEPGRHKLRTQANLRPSQQNASSEKAFDIEVPVAFEFPFGSAGITATWSTKTSMTETGRLEVYGQLAQDDEHDDGANSITWGSDGEPNQQGGHTTLLQGVAVLFCRPGQPFWMHATVKPVVSFSLDPRRVLTKRLIGTEDEPIFLDGFTTLGSSSCLAYDQFDSEEFPWAEILNFPKPLGSATS